MEVEHETRLPLLTLKTWYLNKINVLANTEGAEIVGGAYKVFF